MPPAVATREPERARVSPVGGPSFLGLGDDRSYDLDYLLDDEPPRGHGRLYLALLLLMLSAGLLAWHWQRDGYPWAGLIQGPAANRAPASSVPAPSPTSVTAAQPTGNATPPETPSTTGPATGDAVQPPAAEPPTTQPVTGQAPAESAPSPSPAAVVKPADHTLAPTESSSPGASTAKPSTAPPPEAEEPETTESSPVKETSVPVRKPAAAKPSPTISPASPEDRLVDEGERYLYGRGVRPDCALAQRNLMIGARQSNSKAQTLLGAMYATGHCVNRDLPTAYRWFAKALHGDPGNSRVQRDLEVLWKQMTPEERQLAMKIQ